MTILENQIEREKKDLRSYYINAQKALDAKNLSQAMELSEKGRIQAELENNYEWIQKFNEINSKLQVKPSLNTSIMREDIALIKGVGPSVAEKLREHGFDTIEKLSNTTITQLSTVRGIGPSTAQKIVEDARSLSARKKLNHFTQPEGNPEETSKQVKIEVNTQAKDNSIVISNNPQKWFSDKYKRPKSGVWYPPPNQEGIQQDDSIEFDEQEEFTPDTDVTVISHKEMLSPHCDFVEKEVSQSIQEEIGLPLQGEKLDPSEKQMIENHIGELFQKHNYNLIRSIPLLKEIFNSADFIALKKVEYDNVMDFIIIIPVKVNLLRGELRISKNSIKYIPSHDKYKENSLSFKVFLESYFEHIQDDYHNIF
ncbi:MAG: helix-hairpin-helix domain-containing protein, partial [Candidatus Hermodarchaeota archaeon]